MLLGAPRATSSLAISGGHAPRVSGTAWSLPILLNSLSLPHAAAWEYIRAMAGEVLMLVTSEQCLSLCSSLIHLDLTDVSTPSCWMCIPSYRMGAKPHVQPPKFQARYLKFEPVSDTGSVSNVLGCLIPAARQGRRDVEIKLAGGGGRISPVPLSVPSLPCVPYFPVPVPPPSPPPSLFPKHLLSYCSLL